MGHCQLKALSSSLQSSLAYTLSGVVFQMQVTSREDLCRETDLIWILALSHPKGLQGSQLLYLISVTTTVSIPLQSCFRIRNNLKLGLPWWLSGKESACNAVDSGSIPGWERFPGEENGHPLQYSCLENSIDRGAWRAIQSTGSQELDTT